MAHVKAPFTDDQVHELIEWQAGFKKVYDDKGNLTLMPVHPFTCGGKDCKRSERPDNGVLIPTNDGWVCPCGEYKQDWCHGFMVE